ncbi:carboxymuconolactone decarboxylase family protein [Mycolicibacterium brumae]|uniref:Carboxymuconolactone decarboxylase family protein n=1 Tax=Mycolicibacterium brumae TaxID=85968 RepID=A0A2G5P5I3_9MYCO|nr:carboxymuconolactone decarboxylase family protein [Mycolicibacterium brumae]MCV7191678.1 carboxymuconolactone decarboxylase family protein [Mycolicibacterium brumae]PIB73526.1 carboxymuconolactone decarboxylase family protein [Mycolicibacterium brumae]RWA20467.1 hypothetical protein MBRU_02085 [Mycolicibacterium brumae DSM 44177]UWW07566.1 carboxymuconolactone decarboxylase family protein [Mycolicibacterium brumae]
MSEELHNHDLLTTLGAQGRELRELIPDVYKGFSATSKAAMAEGALSTKVKELIALTIGVTNRCDGCIASHARGAARAGASKEEVAEALGVAILMNGGHSTVYGPRAFAAFSEFSQVQA